MFQKKSRKARLRLLRSHSDSAFTATMAQVAIDIMTRMASSALPTGSLWAMK